MSDVRVRIAPSPTGHGHLGLMRTAIYNWLWARREGGTFILRIEDTDRDRSTEESSRKLFEALRWLGLEWDEGPDKGGPYGPYTQMERLDLYRERAEQLIAGGHAYRCYCTKEELDRQREAQHAAGSKGFRYPGTCRERTDQPDLPYVVRFKAPGEGITGWDDVVKGHLEVTNDTLQDFVLLRSNGVPLYSFGAVVDDSAMRITLVARGDDHVINTAPQILLYRALGLEPPRFAHLPMILGPDGQKLSKRHGSTDVLEYREQGYLPDGVLNYLARLGWSHGDQEIFTREELIEAFCWDHVGTTAARYDAKKFLHVQATHLRMLPDEQLAREVKPFLAGRGVQVGPTDDARLVRTMEVAKPRASTLVELAAAVDFFFREPPEMDDNAKAKFLTPERAGALGELSDVVAQVEPYRTEALENRVKAWLEERGLTLKEVAQPARIALTGRKKSPGLFEVMELLGRDRTLARLRRGAQLAAGSGT